ncbi:MAG: hypothetical protein E6714_13005, partial [Enterobacter sp.]|nr:hypothetical protein [Enterobacter sp.]
DVFAGKKSAQIREILISESAWEEMTCLFAPSLIRAICWPAALFICTRRTSLYTFTAPPAAGIVR